MKYAVLFCLAALSFQSFACDTYEALASTKIASLEFFEDGSCVAAVANFGYFNEHAFCPLSRSAVKKNGVTFEASQCADLQVGTAIDGILVQVSPTEIILD